MPLEIERRFLVAGEAWRTHVHAEQQLQQGYLTKGDDSLTLRVRISRQQQQPARSWLTLKAAAAGDASAWPEGLVRQEFEYPIPLADAESLLALTPRHVHKCRYLLRLTGGDWVVDVFSGANAPLVIAEVELERADCPISPPAWCAMELTGQHAFSNAALASSPFSAWPGQQREPLLRLLHGSGGAESHS